MEGLIFAGAVGELCEGGSMARTIAHQVHTHVMEISSPSANGFVAKTIAPPTRFDTMSFVARDSAMPPTPAAQRKTWDDVSDAQTTAVAL